jgi:hypothetical protein
MYAYSEYMEECMFGLSCSVDQFHPEMEKKHIGNFHMFHIILIKKRVDLLKPGWSLEKY